MQKNAISILRLCSTLNRGVEWRNRSSVSLAGPSKKEAFYKELQQIGHRSNTGGFGLAGSGGITVRNGASIMIERQAEDRCFNKIAVRSLTYGK